MTQVSLTEALAELGDYNVKFQVLNNSITNISQGRRCTKIQFETDKGILDPAELLTGESKNIGLVVWVDRAKYLAAVEAVKAKKNG